ncbi:hypothetical protein FH972_020075 [Carpinus fangiana]|uniref:Ribosomal RNA small subunit methyltransferase NEP1 n=1 Tax=Carpinus fangiana TaxID=176857 RepID=A0A5N6RSL5_9ROSI|nr:hypothetical protein FH972_020075 [Carpinus fangiana]
MGSSSFLKRLLWKWQKLERGWGLTVCFGSFTGVSSGLAAMFSLILYKIWFWVALCYEFYILRSYQLLNSDDHANFLRKNNRNPADYRPDIVHQALLMILDSRINKSGRLRAVYVRTEKGILIEVKPYVRIPRTFKRFAGIMLQLLQKLSISAVGKREKLLRVIKNPVTQYLPINSRRIGLSHSSDKLVNINQYVASAGSDVDLVFVVGAMAHGKIDKDYADDFISVSGYPLSAAYCISMITIALEAKGMLILLVAVMGHEPPLSMICINGSSYKSAFG